LIRRIWTLIFLLIPLFFLFGKTILVRNAAEISAQLNTLQPGDTLLMKSGFWKDQQIVIRGNGTVDQPIVLLAQEPGKVWLTGRSNLRIGGQYVVVSGLYFTNGYSPDGAVVEFRDDRHQPAKHSRLTNSAIVNFNPPNKNTAYKWVSMYGQYNRVDHSYFAGKNHQGATLVVWVATFPNYHRIDHNHFGPRPELGSNGGETIRIGTSDFSMYDSYTTVEWNYFEHCDGEIEIISNKSGKNIYRYNTFDESRGTLTLRHGNACDVYANFFFGNNLDGTGGVRIIGEDQRVYNNYFQDLNGTDLRAAISIMNGVPNSPLNRYFQVKRAKVLFNTVVNSYEPLVIGAGADDEKTLPPKDCLIAGNAILSPYNHEIVTVEAQPINMTWADNIFFGPEIGLPSTPGITVIDLKLALSADGLYRPQEGSPLIGAAQDTFAFITQDMDGQPRTSPTDVGADQVSTEPKVIYPLKAGDVGPDWFPPEPPPIPVIQVQAGLDSLTNALQKADDGDIIELISSGGQYPVSVPLNISKNVTIRGQQGMSELPVIVPAEGDTLNSFFYWSKGKRLNLQKLILDGHQQVSFIFKNSQTNSSLTCDSVTIQNSKFAVFKALSGSLADSLLFSNTSFFHSAAGIVANSEPENSGNYNIKFLKLENCTVWDFKGAFIDIYGGDDIPFTPGPQIMVNHSTFYDCGRSGSSMIDAREVDFTTVKNSIFSLGNSDLPVITLYGQGSSLDYCDFFQTGTVVLNRGAILGSHIWNLDPLFKNAQQGDFALQESSYFWDKADDGYPLGDLRWTGKVLSLNHKDITLNPKTFLLLKNFPNPFNGQTTIQVNTNADGKLHWAIVDVSGRKVASDAFRVFAGQEVRWQWQADSFPSGVYLLKVKVGNIEKAIKLLLVK